MLKSSSLNKIEEILERFWGYSSFRPLQQEIISSVLEKQDTLALLPTGGGKSLCFQVPALCLPGICLVVSPLIALMNDQVDNLNRKGIKAMAITSAMSWGELEWAFNRCIYDKYKFLYVSPERLKTELFQAKLPSLAVSLIAVDEAHCISQWGYDFRPSYLEIEALREQLPGVPVIALTASATPEVVKDIQEKLRFKNGNVFRKSFERKNLHYVVQSEENKVERLINICKKMKGSGIIYVRSRKKCQELAELITKSGFSAAYYHAGLTAEQRIEKQQSWITNKKKIMVATNAFGMGIDKPDVRFVVHFDLPDSIEAYYQEAGRAGRDEKKSYAIALVQEADIQRLRDNVRLSFPEKEEMRQVYQAIVNFYQIAVGSGLGVSVDFNMDEICENYQLKYQQVFYAVRFLEKEGYLSFTDVSFEPSKVLITVAKEELYNFQVRHSRFDKLIKTMLRSYGGLLEQYTHINEVQLASRCGCSRQELQQQLHKLHELEIIDYIPRQQVPKLVFTSNRIESKHLSFSKENYEVLKERALQRMESVIHYVSEKQICRSRLLLNYFGEKEFEDCGQCDVCLKNRKEQQQQNKDEIKKQLLSLLHLKEHSVEELVSSLYRYDKQLVVSIINWMVDDGELKMDQQKNIHLNKTSA